MVNFCAGLLLAEVGAAGPISHVNAGFIRKVKGVIPLIQTW